MHHFHAGRGVFFDALCSKRNGIQPMAPNLEALGVLERLVEKVAHFCYTRWLLISGHPLVAWDLIYSPCFIFICLPLKQIQIFWLIPGALSKHENHCAPVDGFGLKSYRYIYIYNIHTQFLIRGRVDLFRAVRYCANNFELSKSSFPNDGPEALTWAKLLFGLTIRPWPTLWTAWFYWQSAVTTSQDVRQVSGCTTSFLPEKMQMRDRDTKRAENPLSRFFGRLVG